MHQYAIMTQDFIIYSEGKMKKSIVLLLVIVTAISLCACGALGGNSIKTLVQGNLDSLYKGQITNEYLKVVDATEEEVNQDYLDGLDVEAEFFCNYFGLVDPEYDETYDDVSDEIKAEIIEMYKEIYTKSSYTVGDPVEKDDYYEVPLTIEPIDIMEKCLEKAENGYQPYDDFVKKYEEMSLDDMPDEELVKLLDEYNAEYASIIIGLVKETIPELGYKEPKEINVRVEKTEDDFYQINKDDFAAIDDYMIYYP